MTSWFCASIGQSILDLQKVLGRIRLCDNHCRPFKEGNRASDILRWLWRCLTGIILLEGQLPVIWKSSDNGNRTQAQRRKSKDYEKLFHKTSSSLLA